MDGSDTHVRATAQHGAPATGAEPARPKRILALDGGGIRGVISLGVLLRIESMLRERRGRPDLVLADEFDLIAGTSTGAIIAVCLSWGMDVHSVLKLYRAHGTAMFKKHGMLKRVRAKFQSEAIAGMFRELFVEPDGQAATLGSDRLRTMLLVLMRNATTGSPWPLTNNPAALYNDRARDDCNLKIPLWKLLRASTAAPTFFPPEQIVLGSRTFTFIDGGVTPYNNPAFIALLTATLPEYRIGWPGGPDRIMLVSVGTGAARARFSDKPIDRLNLIDHLRYLPPALMGSTSEQQDTLCRVAGRCLYGEPLDSEIGALDGPGPLDGARLCSYARYNPPLTTFMPMDSIAHMRSMEDLGREYGERVVRDEHLL